MRQANRRQKYSLLESSPSLLPLSTHPRTGLDLGYDPIDLGPAAFVALHFDRGAPPSFVRDVGTGICARALAGGSGAGGGALVAGLGHHAHARRRLRRAGDWVVIGDERVVLHGRTHVVECCGRAGGGVVWEVEVGGGGRGKVTGHGAV